MKICAKCNIHKNDNEFYYSNNILLNQCIECKKKYGKQYYLNNKETIEIYRKIYYQKNKKKLITEQLERSKNRKEEISKYQKEYRLRNKDKFKKYRKVKRLRPIQKLRENISNAIYQALKNNSSSKNGSSCFKFLKYSIQDLKNHLEQQFEPWMTWNNWGIYNQKTWDNNNVETWTWQIDHIIPHSTFRYTSMTDSEFKQCWELNNLRPYSAKQNIIDSNKR